MSLNLPAEIFGDVVVVHTPDELAGEQSSDIGRFLTKLDRHNVVVDMDHTESIDSQGLEALLAAQVSLREAGGDLRIATTNYMNRKILEITRIDEQTEVFSSVVDAVKSYR